MFTLLVCADVYGEKINLELTFPYTPGVGEIHRRVTEAFNGEMAARRPDGYPPVSFTITKLQIYDDVMLKWTDLVTTSQLHEYDQLYAFQPQSPWHSDVQRDLPPPRPPTNAAGSAYNSPTRNGSNSVHVSASVGGSPQGPPLQAGPPPQFPGGDAGFQGMPPPPMDQLPPGFVPPPDQFPPGFVPPPDQFPPGFMPPNAFPGGMPGFGQGITGPIVAVTNTPSPTQVQLDEARRREQALRAELRRAHEETERYELLAQREREEELRRQQDEYEHALRQKAEDLRLQREAVERGEAELRKMQATSPAASISPARSPSQTSTAPSQ